MEIRCRSTGQILIFEVSGALNLYHSSSLKDAVDKKMREGARRVIIDLSRVEYIDSSGIGALMICARNLLKFGGALRLVSPSESVIKVLALTKLDKFFSPFASESDALASF